MNKPNLALLAIDPQNDFCDLPKDESGQYTPALPVAGADADMKRLAGFIDRAGSAINTVYVTLDSHQPVDIAHPSWWVNEVGDSPAPFTVITSQDLSNGTWRARNPAMQEESVRYAEALEASGRYMLVVWPEHCLVGTWGNNIHGAVKRSMDRWAKGQMKQVGYVTKGMNPKTEHYSAIRAEVPDSNDPATMLNVPLLKNLAAADLILVAGEALSHCVANTVRDIADNIGEANIGKLVLLSDCTSSVGGFEKLGSDFLAELTARGMRIAQSTDFLA